MSDSVECPNCGETDFWVVMARTRPGVQLPGDSDARTDRVTNRELHLCGGCGICYDPVVAESGD